MLVQHLMTERIFDKVFRDQDFVRRNVIAVEIEKVISALVIRSFNRNEFLKSLDPLYEAIERSSRKIADFSEKQYFLNTVYERFFQGYSVRLADTYGIVYTPQPIVEFMCESVAGILEDEFDVSLGSPGVNILDPCTGTGNFLVHLMRRIDKRLLGRAYRENLFANEVMLLPYYISAQNIEHEYYDILGEYKPFEGLCFVDTLELAGGGQGIMTFMTEGNTARVNRLKNSPIDVIVGNPPYNVGQLSENDNNKNRKYPSIDRRVSETFSADSLASNKNALSDVYVKFFRWAIDRLEGRDGIVCFVSNNGFLHGVAFDGFRKHILREFDIIYHFDCRGNGRALGVRRTLEGRNIFSDQVRVGVGITMLIRKGKRGAPRVYYHKVPDRLKAREKLEYLAKFRSVSDVPWTPLTPDQRGNWLVSENADEFALFLPMSSKSAKSAIAPETVFGDYSFGIKTNRDDVVYDYGSAPLATRVREFIDDYNLEIDRYSRAPGRPPVDNFVNYSKIKWSRDLKKDLVRRNYAEFSEARIRRALYRPFCKKFLYFDRILNEEVYGFPRILPTPESDNRIIVTSDVGYRAPQFGVMMADCLVDQHLCASSDSHQCFPFYAHDDRGVRRENITDWSLARFQERYGDRRISKWDVFYYIYAVLHSPIYRTKFARDLRTELPRIPMLDDFRPLAEMGCRLADLHVGYERVEPWPLSWVYADETPLSYRVEKMRLSGEGTVLHVNEGLCLKGIPPEALAYQLGNRSALDWVIDQYQVKSDRERGGTTDPNRKDDPEYIVRLVGQVVRVSVETTRIVDELPSM